MNTENTISQGFDCEIDQREWLSCKASSESLEMFLISDGNSLGGVAIGRDQIQNLIDFLERSKQVVRP